MTTVGLITTWEVHHLSTVTYPEAQILTKLMNGPKPRPTLRIIPSLMSKCSPYSIAKRRVPELIPVLGSQPAYDVSHKPGSRLPLLSARPQLPSQPLRGLLPISLLGKQRHDGYEQFA